MNKNLVGKLIAINILYTNPSATNQLRKKGKKGRQLIAGLTRSYLWSGVLFLAIYGFSMIFVDFSQMPGMFTYYMALFGLIGFSQALSTIFNVFFESKDLKDYLPLPIKQSEVFVAKFLAVGMTILPFILPLLVLFFITSWRSGIVIPVAVLFSLVAFLIFFILLFGCCSIIIFALSRTMIFKRHKKLFTSLMLGLSMVVSVAGIIAINLTSQTGYGEQIMDRQPLQLFMPFHALLAKTFSPSGLMALIGILLLLVIFAGLIKRLVIPSLYSQFGDDATQTVVVRRKRQTNQSLRKQMWRYNFQLMKNPNLIMQVLTSSLVMPVVFLSTFTITSGLNFQSLGLRFGGVFFVAGLFLALMMTNQTAFIANIISLDRENFDFIKSLPLPLRNYLSYKFWPASLIQLGMVELVGIVAVFLLKLPLTLALSLLGGVLWGTLLCSLYYFRRDYRLLNLTWTNFSQLFTRGGGNFGFALVMMVSFIGGIVIVGIYAALMTFPLPAGIQLAINLGVLGILLALSLVFLIEQRYFWKKIN